MTKSSEHWVELAQYDLDTAEAMFKSGRWLYVLFCSQQCVEKILKAVIALRTGEFPPRIHQLDRLTEVAKITLQPEQVKFINELSTYYIQSRYPEEMGKLAVTLNKKIARSVLTETTEVHAWLKSML